MMFQNNHKKVDQLRHNYGNQFDSTRVMDLKILFVLVWSACPNAPNGQLEFIVRSFKILANANGKPASVLTIRGSVYTVVPNTVGRC